MNKDNITGFRCHDADACAMGQIPCPTPFICGCAAPGCAVKEGTHKPAEAVHQIHEPAPVTAMDALREAEAALEVAIARILKADPGHSICVTSEAKALVAARAALAATAPVDALATGGQAQAHAVEQEPFGYFKAEPFGWTDCGPDDEGAVALYERPQAQAKGNQDE